MAYVKKARRRIKWKIVVPLGLLMLAMIYLAITLFLPRDHQENGIQICGYSASKTQALLEIEHDKTYPISDYFFYGENLVILKEDYKLHKSDDLFGKTIKLRNLCNGNEILFQLNNTVDQQIELGELDNGFYEVYIVNNLQEYRLISDEEIKDVFHTIPRNDETKKIELKATNKILKNKTLKHHYVYLEVSSDEIQKDSYDIMIDPFGGHTDFTNVPDNGIKINGLAENEEMYKAALVLKEKLEAYGVRVGITKSNQNQTVDISGEKGRVHQGYEHHAKLYITLQLNSSEYANTSGMVVYHSNFSSAKLANQIIHDMESNVGLKGSMLYPGNVQNGATPSYLSEKGYDVDMEIRESGGKATGAGTMNEEMKEKNSFATNNRKGMQSIIVKFGFMSNVSDYNTWVNKKDKIMESLADSVMTYYQIEKEGK